MNRLQFRHRKDFHVSPFMDMDFDYHWHLNTPAEMLKVVLTNHQVGKRVFAADMVLRRRSVTRGQIIRTWLRFPWITAQVVSAIYFEALRLWMKKCPYYPHPGTHQTESQ